jgi:Nif-specific regulatory protein
MAADASPRRPPPRWAEHENLLHREIAKRLGRSLEPDAVIREMLHLLSELLGLNRGRVLLFDPALGKLVIRHAYGLTRAEVARGVFAPAEGITGRVYADGRGVIVQDIDAEPVFLCRTVARADLPQETVAYIALPVEIGGRTAGVLGCHRLRRRDRALNDDLHVLGIVATQIGQILTLNRLVGERTAALESENRQLKRALEASAVTAHAAGIVGESPRLLAALGQLERVAPTDATVLLLGESGTGKELFARALHTVSPRRDAPFVKVNCAAIPETLFEAELFGHEKGAFTGAQSARAGRFELAHGGTLFLDEIGEVPLAMQAKLLRALQERVVERVGASRERPVDVRIVAATNRDLKTLVDEGRFRLDLYYRLNVVPVTLPALRERPEDIRPLLRHFLNHFNQAYQRNVGLDAAAAALAERFPWPGNVRQLGNVIERVVLLHDAATIGAPELARVLESEGGARPPPAAGVLVRDYRPVAEGDLARIESALQQAGGNKSRAAQLLGMTLRQLNYRLQKSAARRP